MKSKKIDNGFVVKIEKNERIIETITKFCEENNIKGGYFFGIGAIDEIELAHYNVNTKKYSSKKINELLEITSLIGNIAVEKELVIHAHITVSNEKMQCFAGHLVEAKIAAACEVFLFPTKELKKKYDEEIGLKLLEL